MAKSFSRAFVWPQRSQRTSGTEEVEIVKVEAIQSERNLRVLIFHGEKLDRLYFTVVYVVYG